MSIAFNSAPCAYDFLQRALIDAPVVGGFSEILAVTLTINDPRSRLILGEHETDNFEVYLAHQWAWYASAVRKPQLASLKPQLWSRFLERSDMAVNSNYGHYVWTEGQFSRCVAELKANPLSRRAVIMFNSDKILSSGDEDQVCTTSLQFLIRDHRLHCVATMRSNELTQCFRSDMAFFTLLQEAMAVELGVELGHYHHHVGSMHVKVGQSIGHPHGREWPQIKQGELKHLLGLGRIYSEKPHADHPSDQFYFPLTSLLTSLLST